MTVKNPWGELAQTPPYILSEDAKKLGGLAGTQAGVPVRVDMLPCPFIGSPEQSQVVLLNLNPAFKEDIAWEHGEPRYKEALQKALTFENEIPFWPLDPSLAEYAGNAWWAKKLRSLSADAPLSVLQTGLMCIQLFPYHTATKPSRMLNLLADTASGNFLRYLVEQSIAARKILIVLRSYNDWCEHVPALREAEVVRLRNSRNPALSPGNMGDDSYRKLLVMLNGSRSVPKADRQRDRVLNTTERNLSTRKTMNATSNDAVYRMKLMGLSGDLIQVAKEIESRFNEEEISTHLEANKPEKLIHKKLEERGGAFGGIYPLSNKGILRISLHDRSGVVQALAKQSGIALIKQKSRDCWYDLELKEAIDKSRRYAIADLYRAAFDNYQYGR